MARDNTNSSRRSRSRSPQPQSSKRHRSRSPHRRHHRHHHHEHSSSHSHSHSHNRKRDPIDTSSIIPPSAVPPRPIILPFKARQLNKYDLDTFKPMFASYLDIQKGFLLEELDEREIKGRWKGFVSRWNRGDLAAGWYDPESLEKAVESARVMAVEEDNGEDDKGEEERGVEEDDVRDKQGEKTEDEEDEDIGPAPPPLSSWKVRLGPSIPTRSDLILRDESVAEASAASLNDHRMARKAERDLARSRLDELAPRAEAGTRERQLEKKREVAAGNRGFAEAKGGGDGLFDVPEDVAMGGGGEGVREMKARDERKKNEREIRREEILRARQAEREERLVGMRVREEKTMEMLKRLAEERFGR